MKNQIKFIKGTVASVTDKHDNTGIDLLLTPEDIKNLSTGKGYVPISIRIGKDGKYYAYKATHRLVPSKPIVDDVYDLARISIEEVEHHDLDAVSEALHQAEYKEVNDHLGKESVHINDIIAKVTEEWRQR
tara:strand:+ start:265 stop:657 length:393 start_codon:yes stop_codon:yes gene_type:complete